MSKNRLQLPVFAFLGVVFLLGLAVSACGSAENSSSSASVVESPTKTALPADPISEQQAVWRQVLASNPADLEANYYLGLLLAITNPEEAASYFETASVDPVLAANINRVTDALQIGELSDNPVYRLTLLGQALGALQEWELALSALELATQADPNYPEAWAYLGEAQQQNGQDGLQALETALSLDPESYAANLLMALYLRRNNSPAEALDLLLVAATQDPNNLSLKEDIAYAYADSGDVESGLELLEEAADSSPDLPLVWQMLARMTLNYDIKLTEVGLPAARQAVLLDAEDPANLLLLGRCYLQTGNTSIAERFLWQAVQLEPGNAEAHYYLGLLYLNAGDQSTAQEQLNLAYRLAPEDTVGLQAYQVLEQYFGSSQ